jgi:hypothetical protein
VGIFWLIITPGLWIGSGGMLGWICHDIVAVTAYNYDKRSEKADDKPPGASHHPRVQAARGTVNHDASA